MLRITRMVRIPVLTNSPECGHPRYCGRIPGVSKQTMYVLPFIKHLIDRGKKSCIQIILLHINRIHIYFSRHYAGGSAGLVYTSRQNIAGTFHRAGFTHTDPAKPHRIRLLEHTVALLDNRPAHRCPGQLGLHKPSVPFFMFGHPAGNRLHPDSNLQRQ